MSKKTFITMMATIFATFMLFIGTGCAYLEANKENIGALIINVVEHEGQIAAKLYVDKLVADGKLSAEDAEKVKAAIPYGIERVKEVLGYVTK